MGQTQTSAAQSLRRLVSYGGYSETIHPSSENQAVTYFCCDRYYRG